MTGVDETVSRAINLSFELTSATFGWFTTSLTIEDFLLELGGFMPGYQRVGFASIMLTIQESTAICLDHDNSWYVFPSGCEDLGLICRVSHVSLAFGGHLDVLKGF